MSRKLESIRSEDIKSVSLVGDRVEKLFQFTWKDGSQHALLVLLEPDGTWRPNYTMYHSVLTKDGCPWCKQMESRICGVFNPSNKSKIRELFDILWEHPKVRLDILFADLKKQEWEDTQSS